MRQSIKKVRRFYRKCKEDRIDVYAAQASFFILLSVMPAIMLILTLIQYFPITAEQMTEFLMDIFPRDVSKYIKMIIDEIFVPSKALLSGSAIAAVWAAGKGIMGLTNGLNSVNRVKETRNYFMIRIRSAFYMILMLMAFIVTVGILIFGNEILIFLQEKIPIIKSLSSYIISAQTSAALILLLVLFLSLYVILPNRKTKLSRQLPGAALASLAWAVCSYGFSIYMDIYSRISKVYGSLGSIMAVMLWLYLCMWILFMGAEINCYLEDPKSFNLTDD
ncbi:MAG: YihY/virulence factor BrkB family protein [Clostridiales bacterium]|nr:YihY/virulence factor BrkB family protein [Clostridiales bacterium]